MEPAKLVEIRKSLYLFSLRHGLVFGVFLVGILRMKLGENLSEDAEWEINLKALNRECGLDLLTLQAYYNSW